MIDRKKLVFRHSPRLKEIDPLSPLSVGNGEFAFTADFTGLQTFPHAYEVPLSTQSQWGWHYTDSPNKYELKDSEFQSFIVEGREVDYPLYPNDNEKAYHWLRQNPHRLQLGQISFRFLDDHQHLIELSDVKPTEQMLNLWEGTLYSQFSIKDEHVSVTTICHPYLDQIAIKVTSPLQMKNKIEIIIRFPSPDLASTIWEETTHLGWGDSHRHQTKIVSETKTSITLKRKMDDNSYFVNWTWDSGEIKSRANHEFVLIPDTDQGEFMFTVHFSSNEMNAVTFRDTDRECKQYWSTFWKQGGMIELSESKDERAYELERRVILSQFLTAIHCSGSMPPQETGYMYNSWFGKFHLEMHWWHAAHFPLWGRSHMLEKSLAWYYELLPIAKELAVSQGYEGVRWPKMIGENGKQSPSTIAPLLIWQQPHPIFLAELCFRANPKKTTLLRWKDIVVESAHFMASYTIWDEQKQAYILGPPLIPAQECHRPEKSCNPPYELEYWKFGLDTAIMWVKRMGEPVPQKWLEVTKAIAKPPHNHEVYLAHEDCFDTFDTYNHDHPSMVGAFGILPGVLIDRTIMKKTLLMIHDKWKWETAWGWDFPMCAMTAARLGQQELAIDFLLMDVTKNTYLPNGHNYQSPSLTAYLPGNGGLLTAVSMMAKGWDGEKACDAPGFPQNGQWVVKSEGILPYI